MRALRDSLRHHRMMAALILALALAMKAFVPTGFMIGAIGTAATGATLTVQICDGQGQTTLKRIDLPGKPGHPSESETEHAKAARECPFTGLSMAGLGASDPVLLALALAFILALGFLPVAPLRLAPRAYLTPPLRGPPLTS